MLGLGTFSERYGVYWGPMLLIWEILGKSEALAKTGNYMEKPPETALMGLQIGCGGVNSVSQVDGGDSDMLLTC